MAAVAPGTLLGRYEIRSPLGAGGMGEVYLAQDTQLERTVALKVLPAEVASDQKRMGRFKQEARAASALNHPNVAHIYEIGEASGINFIAMEFVDGVTLRNALARIRTKTDEVLHVALQVASALSAAHPNRSPTSSPIRFSGSTYHAMANNSSSRAVTSPAT